MDAIVGALITAVVGGPLLYLLGHRRLRYERLYEKRAEVIARPSELLYLMQRGMTSWSSPFQSGDADRDEQRRIASEALDNLILYFYSNEVWLDRDTCDKVSSLIETAYMAGWDYSDNLNERGHPRDVDGRDASIRLMNEIPALRTEMEAEFRAILYPPPWYDLPLRLLERLPRRQERVPDEPDV